MTGELRVQHTGPGVQGGATAAGTGAPTGPERVAGVVDKDRVVCRSARLGGREEGAYMLKSSDIHSKKKKKKRVQFTRTQN